MENEALKILDAYNKVKQKEAVERDLWKMFFEYVNNRVDGKLGQWSQEIRARLGDKPTISFNEIKKFVNRICGAQRQTKVDEKAFPRDDMADPVTADAITDLMKYVRYINQFDTRFSRCFRDGIICSRGFMKVEWSDELDPTGEISVKRINPRRVYILGSGEEYDLQDRSGIIEEIPMDKDEIIGRWPSAEKDIDTVAKSAGRDEEIPVAEDLDYSFGKSVPTDLIYDKNEKKYIVLRCQRRVYKDITFIVYPDGQRKEFEGKKKELTTALEILQQTTGAQFTTIKKRVPKIKITYLLGNVVLEDEFSIYKHNKYDVVPLFAYLDDGFSTGVVQDLIDPQDEKNKRHSQIIHILGTAAKNSYWATKGALDDIEDARLRLGKVGEIIEVNGDLNNALRPRDSNLSAVPSIVNMDASATMEMKEISGLHDASMGQVPEGVKSGRGMEALQAPVEIIISELFDNGMTTRKLIHELIVSLIQQFYTTERKVRILGEYHPALMGANEQTMQQGGALQVNPGEKLMTINKPQPDGTVMNDVTVGRYDIAIDHISYHPTMRQARYYELMNMKMAGAPIKWSTVVKASDIPGKQEVLKDVMEMEMGAANAGVPPQVVGNPPMANAPKSPVPPETGQNLLGNRNG